MRYTLFYAGFNDINGKEQIGIAQSEDFVNFAYVGKEPAIPLKSQGVFDEAQTSNPCVIKHNGIYKMWYQGKSADGLISICYAESKDGLDWKVSKEPVLFPYENVSVGNYREGFHQPHVIFDESRNIFKLWCTASRSEVTSICYAESANGIVWNELVSTNIVGQDSKSKVWYPCVIKEGSVYKMWFTRRNSSKEWSVCYAISSDGIAWKEKNLPVISPAQPRILAHIFEGVAKYFKINIEMPFYGIGSPFVWKEGGNYYLLGHEVGVRGKLYIPRYVSSDGIAWKKIKNNILPPSFEEWNKFFQADPFLYVE